MLKSRFGKLGIAGFAAVAGVILVVSSAGAHHGSSQAGLAPFTGIGSTTTQAGADVDNDAAADAAAAAAELAAEQAAEQAAAQAEAAAEAAEDAQDQDTDTETETGDTETGAAADDTGTNASTGAKSD